MSDTVLKVEGLYKKFTKSLKRSMLHGTADMLRGMLGAHVSEELRKGEFWALQDIHTILYKKSL
jgi:lipopolysaccharide transport system ATP-binding protein